MLKIRNVINASGECVQRFLQTNIASSGCDDTADAQLQEIILDHRISMVASCADGKIIKLLKARTWHENFKLLYAKSRVHIEFFGAQKLRSAGIKTPQIYEMGIRLPWQLKSDFIGYYIMEDLRVSGSMSIEALIVSDLLNEISSNKIFELLLNDLKKMKKNKIIYTDLSFSNIFYNREKCFITFIDTGVKSVLNADRFSKRFFSVIKKFGDGGAKKLFSTHQINELFLALKS